MTKREIAALKYLAEQNRTTSVMAMVIGDARAHHAEPLAAAKRYIALLKDIDAVLTAEGFGEAVGGWR